MQSLELKRDWTLTFTDPRSGDQTRLATSVPGYAETDLERQGLTGELFPCDNLNASRVWEQVDDWTYQTTFEAPILNHGEQAFLRLEGVDTIAEVFLNEHLILRCENMFIAHEVEVSDLLESQTNHLRIIIHSPVLAARQIPCDNYAYGAPRREALVLRKAQHMWGWDNAPRMLGAGLWRPVWLDIRPAIRFDEVYLYTAQVDASRVRIGIHWRIRTPDKDLSTYHGLLTLANGKGIVHNFPFAIEFTAGTGIFTIPRDQIDLWWPRGMGVAALYQATVTVYRGDSEVTSWQSQFGVRELTLVYTEETTRDGDGEFIFICNGEKVFINGTNWKPLRPTPIYSRQEIENGLQLALDLNCNMVRVWGGGVYEDHEFFNFCDLHGLMVWQDFMFACRQPPQDEGFQTKVAVEAAWVVKRLRNHPSLTLWCGDNEVDQSATWAGRPGPRKPSDNLINRQILSRAVVMYDPHRVYLPSSPYFSDRAAEHRMANNRPWLAKNGKSEWFPADEHFYPIDEHFRNNYRTAANHFMSETGPFFLSAMSQSADIVIREMPRIKRLWDVPFDRDRYTLTTYQTDEDFLTWKDAARKRLNHLFARDFSPDEWENLALGVNIICGEMFKFAIEWSRSHKWRKTGVLWWSLLDMWPMTFNYSVVDANHQPKQPCYDWIKQSQQPFCLMIANPEQGPLELVAANDTRVEQFGDWRLLAVDATGHESEVASGQFSIGANTSLQIRELERPAEARLWIIEWNGPEGAGKNHFVTGTPPYDFQTYKGWLDRITPTSNDALKINP